MSGKFNLPLIFLVGFLAVLVLPELAQADPTEMERVEAASRELYCEIYNVISGNLGLVIGLVMAFIGFMQVMLGEGRNITPGVLLIFMGVLVTAAPSLLRWTLQTWQQVSGYIDPDEMPDFPDEGGFCD